VTDTMRIAFLGEGSSDNGIAPHIERLAAERRIRSSVTVPDFARLGSKIGHSVPEKLCALRGFGDEYDLVVVHRDADNAGHEARAAEISQAMSAEWAEIAHVPAIPVRMLEAWLLLDEQAIRQVSENPNGRMALGLPKLAAIERHADPKALLKETLARASGLSGRRFEQFQRRFPQHRLRLLELLDPRGPVLTLPSWNRFVGDLDGAFSAWLERHGN
jgi:Domain of unknown function (DUF4276)